jgi:hypothetical protein
VKTSQRRRWEAVVRELPVPVPFDLEVFCAELGQQLGRPLVVSAWDDDRMRRRAPCGLVARTAEMDLIHYDASTSELHGRHSVFHEVGHILADHRPVAGAPAESVGALLPDLDPSAINVVLARGVYDSPDEEEADLIATLLGLRVDAVSPGDDPALRRMTEVFGHDLH